MKRITVHCSYSDIPAHDDIIVIHNWHLERTPPFRKCGYHFFIKSNGDIQDYTTNPDEARRLHPFEQGAHVLNHNRDNIGICLHGTYEFTEAQFFSLRRLVHNLMFEFGIHKDDVRGHSSFPGHSTRGCPNFDVHQVLFGVRGVRQVY